MKTTVDQIGQHHKRNFYKTNFKKKDGEWRKYFRTQVVDSGDPYTKEYVYAGLDQCLEEIQNFKNEVGKNDRS